MIARTYTRLGPDRQPRQNAPTGTLGGHRPDRVYGGLDGPAAFRALARGGALCQRTLLAPAF
jgi:hypothetical protein